MLIDFLFELRARKLPVSTHEWMALMEAMALGLHDSSLDGFYRLCRTLCVKDIALYDAFDEAFLAYFKDVHVDALRLTEQLARVAGRPAARSTASPRSSARRSQALDLEKLRELFEQRLKEQKERHDGGNRWIGTGGTSPFGTGGTNPTGDARRRRRRPQRDGRSPTSAVSSEYRRDLVLDVRQIDVALRSLRRLGARARQDELDIDETIDETAQERRRARDRVPAAAPQPGQGASC